MAAVIPLKYPKSEKNEFFDPPPIFLRTEGHVRSYDGDSDSPWQVVFTHAYGSYFGLT